jgi:plastocyanin
MSRPTTLVVAALLLFGAVACGGDSGSEPIRSYTLGLEVDDSGDRYRYVATDPVDIRVGDEVTFALDNTGALVHDLQVVDPSGATIARAEPVLPGRQASVTVRFDEPGFFRLNCLVDDHLIAHEMQTFIEVNESSR